MVETFCFPTICSLLTRNVEIRLTQFLGPSEQQLTKIKPTVLISPLPLHPWSELRKIYVPSVITSLRRFWASQYVIYLQGWALSVFFIKWKKQFFAASNQWIGRGVGDFNKPGTWYRSIASFCSDFGLEVAKFPTLYNVSPILLSESLYYPSLVPFQQQYNLNWTCSVFTLVQYIVLVTVTFTVHCVQVNSNLLQI